MSWNSGRSSFSGSTYSYPSTDAYGSGKHQYNTAAAADGKTPAKPSRLKKSSGKNDDDNNNAAAVGYPASGGGYGGKNNYGGGYGGYNAGSVTLYGGGVGTPYYGGGGSGPYTGGRVLSGYLTAQDGSRSPMVIHTREVHVYGSPYDGDGDQRRRNSGSGGGFFRPAFQAVGHFFDRKLGLHDRD
uniref:Uncharacterized protein n=1 Tax=Leersia perrieri TaxID=77586 RepID=A0A0D9V9H7_9ORYZ